VIARSRPKGGSPTDASMGLIVVSGWVGFAIAFSVANSPRFILQNGQKMWFAAGLALMLLGSRLRHHCFRVLGKYFTGDVKVVEGQRVIEDGIYHWVRHPSYTGGIMMYVGTGLALTNWVSALAMGISAPLGYAYRVRVEERALRERLGDSYEQYMRRTTRFVPFLF